MQKYNGQLIRQFASSVSGNAASGVTVTVRRKSDNALATLYADNNTAGATLLNPITTIETGHFAFYAADGVYTLTFSDNTPQQVIQLQDVAALQDQFDSAVLNAGYIPSGTFAAGATLTQANQVLSDGSSYWRWDGSFPKTVTAGSAPTPTGAGGWVLLSDQALRGELAAANSNVLIAGLTADSIVKRLAKRVAFTELGGVADGVTDNRAAYVSAINSAAADGFTLVFTRGVYGFSDWIPLTSNLRMEFEEGAELKLLATTGPIGGFVIGGASYPAFNPIAFENCHIVNPTIDCNNLVGENGLNAIAANGFYIYNPTIKNCKRSDVALGGRAFQFEGGIIKNIQVYNPKIINCSIGINSQGDPTGVYVATDINYYDVYMKNVDVPFNIDSGFALPQTNTPLTMSTTVRGATLYNCGRLTYPGVTDPIGGGIICGDRGFGLSVSDVRVINEAAYGGIGAICRGTMFGVRLRNVTFYGSSMTAVFDHNPVAFGAPSGASWESYVDADDIAVDANLDYVVATKGGGGALGKSSMTNIKLKGVAATVSAICDVNAATYSNAVLEVVDVDNSFVGEFKGTGVRALDELAALGNQLNSETLGLQKINQTSGAWSPSYTAQSTGPAAITMNVTGAAWSRTGDVVTAWADIATDNLTLGGMAGAVIITGLPYNAQYTVAASITDCNTFTNHPLTAKVAATTNYIELYKRASTTSADAALQPSDLTAGAVVGANNIVVTLTYKAII